MPKNVCVIGGGAAGFFFALNCAEKNPGYRITILERSDKLLEKVRISGGGRCNLTNACFDPALLVKNYPRGNRELLGAFHRFMPADTISWFEDRAVPLKTEPDGRMFPESDEAESVASCLLQGARERGIRICTKQEVDRLNYSSGYWQISTADGQDYTADIVFVATGSALRMWDMLKRLGYRIAPPVPSLFTFTIKDPRLKGLQGISVENANIGISGTKLIQSGPLLITHWGLSGPAVLKLSAWGARLLHGRKYKFEINVNWVGGKTPAEIESRLKSRKVEAARKQLISNPEEGIPARLWESLCQHAGIPETMKWADLPAKTLEKLALLLSNSIFQVEGKSTFKEEFVTCGGVELDQVDFRTFQSRLHPGLYFGGEVLDIDAVTGGFNFQAAWTSAWVAAQNV